MFCKHFFFKNTLEIPQSCNYICRVKSYFQENVSRPFYQLVNIQETLCVMFQEAIWCCIEYLLNF